MGVQRTPQRGWQGLEGEQAQGSEGPLSPPVLKIWWPSSTSSSFSQAHVQRVTRLGDS